MERFCGDVVRHIKSRRYPYISINNYVTASAHLTQVQLLYNLEELSFNRKESQDRQTVYDACEYASSGRDSSNTYTIQDNLFVLKAPRKESTLPPELWKKVTAALATRYDVKAGSVRRFLPKDLTVIQFGRISRSDGGDSMQGRDLVKMRNGERDASFIRVGFVAASPYIAV